MFFKQKEKSHCHCDERQQSGNIVITTIYNYKTLQKEAAQKIVDVADSQLAVSYDKPIVKSSAASYDTALINAVDCDEYRWCKVVEQTLEHFANTGKDTLIRLKYFNKVKKEWRLCEELYISRPCLYSWVDDILQYAVMCAIQLEILRIF